MRHHFKGLMKHLLNMIFLLVFVVSVFDEVTPAITAAELLSRDEMVELAGYGEDKLSTVVIDGNLICHAAPGHKIPRTPIPVSGATVGIFCHTKKNSWAQGKTNSYGEFIIDLPSNLHSIPNLEKMCTVKIIRLPKSCPCRRALTGKHKGIIKLSSINGGVRLYTTHDIHLMPKPSLRQG